MYVVGTAGHVDHGKSTLVQALTGIDPDRFQEEKQRGMTIDLGFAWFTLPSGREVSIVDVPGHSRFIKNMLAGIGSIDLALVLVAANESVMPQTREHIAILDLLGVQNGIIVIAKKDLVDQEMLDLVEAEIDDIISGTSLWSSPVVSVSSVTGEGLQELIKTIDNVLEPSKAKPVIGNPRVPIDRSFSISGFGTVITGTLIDGSLHVGQEVELLPSGLKSKIRGLQSHQQKITEAQPGFRVAVNLSGLSKEDIKRGEVLTTSRWLRPSKAIDTRLRLLETSKPIRHNRTVSFHTGSSETTALVRLLEGNEIRPGEDMLAQIRLINPLPVVKGDYFVLRDSDSTIGGGAIIEAHAKRHKRNFAPILQTLNTIENGTPEEVMKQILQARDFIGIQEISKQMDLSPEEILRITMNIDIKNSIFVLESSNSTKMSLLFSMAKWNVMVTRVGNLISHYHLDNPLRKGMPKEELRSRLELSIQGFTLVIGYMLEKQLYIEESKLLRLPNHKVSLSQGQNDIVQSYLNHILSDPYSPPTDLQLDGDLLEFLVIEGRVVKVGTSIIYEANIFRNMSDIIVKTIEDTGKIDVAQVRDRFQTSRKYALALLEYLDQQRVTRRVGDDRILR